MDINSLGGFNFDGLLCHDFFPLNEASHHNFLPYVPNVPSSIKTKGVCFCQTFSALSNI